MFAYAHILYMDIVVYLMMMVALTIKIVYDGLLKLLYHMQKQVKVFL